jgi:hypothetical protein
MKTNYNDKQNILIIRKKKHLFGFNYEIHTNRNKLCQIEIFLTIIICIYNVKIIYIYINYL